LDDVAGNTADQILSLATGITQTSQPGGSTLYSGTIPNSSGDPNVLPSDDAILRIIDSLRSGNEPGAPVGFHNAWGARTRSSCGEFVFVNQPTEKIAAAHLESARCRDGGDR
jgi:hypothetical protein